jgi:hypothetical protein
MTPSTSRGPVDINSIIAGMVDRGVWQYYDELITAAGTQLQSSYTLFSYPLGVNDPITGIPKTKINTNMTVSKQFSPPRCLVLMDMGLFFAGMSLADMLIMEHNYYYEFRIDDKIFFEGRLEFLPSGLGNFGSSTVSGDASWANGIPLVQARRSYGRYSKYIAPLQQFTASLVCGYQTPPTLTAANVGGKGLDLLWILDGLTDRSVQ